MNRTAWLAWPAILLGCSLPAQSAPSAEQSLRDIDAAWVRAAQSGSVDGWMAFYADDALVLPPNEVAADTGAAIRRSIAEVLALPGLQIEWHPIRIEMSAGGELAALAGAYTLSYRDPAGAVVSDRGKLLEVWRRRPGGEWKCVLDTWNSDLAAPVAAAPVAAAPAPDAELAAAPTQAQLDGADYGEMPHRYEDAIHAYFRRVLANPLSVHYGAITAPQHGFLRSAGLFVRHPGWLFGWTVTATVDAQSSWGAWVGPKTYTFLFRGEKLIGTLAPPSEGEMK